MSKKVTFKPKPTSAVPANADEWVSGENPKAKKQEEEEPKKRFTFDVPESLHRRVKIGCAARGVEMAEVVRQLLEKEFPE
jgi:predicted DNA binding CopG/RHH family protein